MTLEQIGGTAAGETGATPEGTAPAPASATARPEGAEESFIDPSELPEELKPHWRRMHRAYTKWNEGRKEVQDKAALVDRFNTDPDFTLQVLNESAQRMGYQLSQATPGGQMPSGVSAAQTVSASPEAVQAVEHTLPPELKWMAPMITASVQTLVERQVTPLRKQQETERNEAWKEQYQASADALSDIAPGWEEHEDDMSGLLEFIRSDRVSDRKWGSKLQLLHSVVTGNAHAVATALERQREAARARTTTGAPGRTSMPNIEERVMKAPSLHEAFQVAAEEATKTLEREGRRFA